MKRGESITFKDPTQLSFIGDRPHTQYKVGDAIEYAARHWTIKQMDPTVELTLTAENLNNDPTPNMAEPFDRPGPGQSAESMGGYYPFFDPITGEYTMPKGDAKGGDASETGKLTGFRPYPVAPHGPAMENKPAVRTEVGWGQGVARASVIDAKAAKVWKMLGLSSKIKGNQK